MLYMLVICFDHKFYLNYDWLLILFNLEINFLERISKGKRWDLLKLLVPFAHSVWRMPWFNSIVVEKVSIWALKTKLHMDRPYLTRKPTYIRHHQQYSQTTSSTEVSSEHAARDSHHQFPKCHFAFKFWIKYGLYKNHSMLFSNLAKIQLSSTNYL